MPLTAGGHLNWRHTAKPLLTRPGSHLENQLAHSVGWFQRLLAIVTCNATEVRSSKFRQLLFLYRVALTTYH